MQELLKDIGKDYVEKDIFEDESDEHTEQELTTASKSSTWSIVNNHGWMKPTLATKSTLEAGIYEIQQDFYGYYIAPKIINTDDLIKLPNATEDDLLKHIDDFWQLKSTFKELGFIHKRGILMFGPPGGSKSVTVVQILKECADKYGTIGVYCESPYEMKFASSAIRSIEGEDRPIIMVTEDIDEMVSRYGDKALTSVLDGENNTQNILYLSTTNYINRLPPRIVNRPSRFDVIKEMAYPTDEAREVFIRAKIPTLNDEQVKQWIDNTTGFSIPMVKELFTLVLAYTKPLKESATHIKSLFNSIKVR